MTLFSPFLKRAAIKHVTSDFNPILHFWIILLFIYSRSLTTNNREIANSLIAIIEHLTELSSPEARLFIVVESFRRCETAFEHPVYSLFFLPRVN